MWFMTNLYTWLGPNFSLYFTLSFILRSLVAFSAFIFLYILTKNRLASILGGLLIVVGFSGIQTTFEIINMIAYISYIGWLIFLCAFFLIQDRVSFKYLITMGISLLLATLIASFRIYPLYAWAFIVDSLNTLGRFRKNRIKFFLMRQMVIFAVFLFLYKIGIFSWYSRDASSGHKISDLNKFVTDITSFIVSINTKIISNFLKGLGNVIFPDILDKAGNISLFLGIFYMFVLIGLFVYIIRKRTTRDIYLLFVFLIWPLLFYASYFLIYINGINLKDTAILQSSMRYLYPPFIGFSIALVIFLSIMSKIKSKLSKIALISVIILVFVHALTTYNYLNKLSKIRDGNYMVKIWRQIQILVPESSLSNEQVNIFYFETDGTERAIYTVNDGFIGHAITMYKIDSKPVEFDPIEIGNFGRLIAPPIIYYEELVSYIKKNSVNDSKSDIWDRIFALKVIGEKVIDIKTEVKARAVKSLNK